MREKLIELIDEKQVYGIDKVQPRKHDIMLLDNDELADHLIAKGVTIPTRCEDCRFWTDGVEGCTDNEKCCRIGCYMTKGNDYCAYGKRKITE